VGCGVCQEVPTRPGGKQSETSKILIHPVTDIFKNIYILSKHGIQARNDSHKL
jgi:hypothetical protein